MLKQVKILSLKIIQMVMKCMIKHLNTTMKLKFKLSKRKKLKILTNFGKRQISLEIWLVLNFRISMT